MSVIIRAQGVSKKYVLRHQTSSSYLSLRDAITNGIKKVFSRSKGATPGREDFWALRDVSFEVNAGEAIGIIGRNGSGKSTLLKTLSRITKPTEGRIEIRGRVGSLLEVGTGFHPELTGRENIYLNGAIMGMSSQEIRKRFDAIIAFAESERFLDTPVKHFSSGMYVRLAFAVAAHLEPDVLIVDEGLAVGDLQFQKKCLSKMADVTSHDGGTVLFVSHSMDLITKLCSKALLLRDGKAIAFGPVDEVTREYLKQANTMQTSFHAQHATRPLRYVILDEEALTHEKLVLRVGFRFPHRLREPVFAIVISSDTGTVITASNTRFHPLKSPDGNVQEGEAVVEFEHLPLWSDRYTITLWLNDGWMVIDHEDSVISFEFLSQSAPLKTQSIRELGAVHLPAAWTVTGDLRKF